MKVKCENTLLKFEVTLVTQESKKIRDLVTYRYQGKRVLNLNDKGVTVSGGDWAEPHIYIFMDSILSDYFDQEMYWDLLNSKQMAQFEEHVISRTSRTVADISIHELIHAIFYEDGIGHGREHRRFDPKKNRMSLLHMEIESMANKLAVESIPEPVKSPNGS